MGMESACVFKFANYAETALPSSTKQQRLSTYNSIQLFIENVVVVVSDNGKFNSAIFFIALRTLLM